MSAEPNPTPGPALDPNQLTMLRSLRNGQLLPQLLRTYRAQATQQLHNLKEALTNQSCSELGTISHSFKSASYSIGAKHVGEMCAQLEAAARNNKLAECLPMVGLLEDRVAEVLQEIDAHLT